MGIVRLKPYYLESKKAEQAFKRKHDAEKVNELFDMFNLPHVSTKGYETKQLVGASAAAINTDAQKLNAVNELLMSQMV